MMNQTLQKELTAHLRVINGRENFISKWKEKQEKDTEKIKDEWDKEKEINKLIHLKAKNYLDKENFKFGKDRDVYQSLIIWQDDFVQERRFHERSFHIVDFANGTLNNYLPRGFTEAVIQSKAKIERIRRLNIKFNGTIKLNKRNEYQKIESYDYKLKTDKVEKIELNNSGSKYSRNIEIELDRYSERWAYHNSRIFRKILKLMNKFERHIGNLIEVRNKMRVEAEDFINHQFDKIIILRELEE